MKKYMIVLLIFLSLFMVACKKNGQATLRFEEESINLGVGEDFILNPLTTNYSGGFNIKISDPSIVSLSHTKLTGLKEGSVMIVVSLALNSSIKAYLICEVVDRDLVYEIEYVLNGGSISINSPTSYKLSQTPLDLPIAKRADYTFDAWYTSSDFSGPALRSLPEGFSQDIKLYAKWLK